MISDQQKVDGRKEPIKIKGVKGEEKGRWSFKPKRRLLKLKLYV